MTGNLCTKMIKVRNFDLTLYNLVRFDIVLRYFILYKYIHRETRICFHYYSNFSVFFNIKIHSIYKHFTLWKDIPETFIWRHHHMIFHYHCYCCCQVLMLCLVAVELCRLLCRLWNRALMSYYCYCWYCFLSWRCLSCCYLWNYCYCCCSRE